MRSLSFFIIDIFALNTLAYAPISESAGCSKTEPFSQPGPRSRLCIRPFTQNCRQLLGNLVSIMWSCKAVIWFIYRRCLNRPGAIYNSLSYVHMMVWRRERGKRSSSSLPHDDLLALPIVKTTWWRLWKLSQWNPVCALSTDIIIEVAQVEGVLHLDLLWHTGVVLAAAAAPHFFSLSPPRRKRLLITDLDTDLIISGSTRTTPPRGSGSMGCLRRRWWQ